MGKTVKMSFKGKILQEMSSRTKFYMKHLYEGGTNVYINNKLVDQFQRDLAGNIDDSSTKMYI